jgi:hypothetical protein
LPLLYLTPMIAPISEGLDGFARIRLATSAPTGDQTTRGPHDVRSMPEMSQRPREVEG